MVRPRNLTFALAILALAAAGAWFLASPPPVEAACTAALSYGDTVDCDISVASEVDTFTFSGADGETVLIRAYEVDQALDLHVKLLDPSAGTVCSDQTATFQLDTECDLSATGTYSIEVWSDDTDTGDYLLYIARTSDPPSPAATAISYGDVTSATLGQMEWKAFEFEATAGEEIVITVDGTSGSIDPWMYLRPAGGDTFCSASGAGTNAKLCSIGTTGTYHVWILSWQGHQSGDFDLYVARTSDPKTEAVSWQRYGETVSRSLDALHYNPHQFFGEDGDVVEVDVAATSGNLIWLVHVYRPNGDLMCSASGFNHVDPECTLNSTGVHTAWAFAWSPSSTAVYDTTVSRVGLADPTPSSTDHPAFAPSYPVIAPATGFGHEQTDVAIPGKGVPMSFSRYYHSGSPVDRSMGLGWTHSYDVYLVEGAEAVEVHYPQGHSSTFSFDPDGGLAPVGGITDELVKHVDDTFTLTTKGQVRYEFDSGGVLRSIRDRNAVETELFYDVNGDLDYVEDAGGRRLDFTIDANGRITKIDLPLTRSVQYAYNGNGELTTFTDLLAGTTTYAYGTYGMTSITDPRSNVAVTNGYDTDGRLREQTNALSKSTCTYYGTGASYSSTACTGVSPAAGADEVVVVDAEGNAARFGWGSLYRTTTITDALGGVTTNVFDLKNNVTSVINPLNQTTSFTYDQNRNVLTQTDALNQTWTYTYNAFNDVLTATDPRNKVTTYAYDVDGNLTSVTDAASNVTTFTVGLEGLVTKVTDGRLNETDYTYDTYGNRATVTNQLDDVWTYTYDAGSRLTKVRDPLTHDVDYTYNNADQVLTVTNHLSEVTTNVYDANGNLTSVTDAESNATTYVYDAANRLTKITDDLAQDTTYAYDDVGNQTSVTNVRGKITSYQYDALYRRTKVTDPLSRVTEYRYDAAGNQIRRVDARDLITTYEYDAVNQLTQVNYVTLQDVATHVSDLGADVQLYWRLGETSGTNANDETANNRDGTIDANVTLDVPGAVLFDEDPAMRFDGTAGTAVTLASGSGIPTGQAARSVGVWFRTDQTAVNSDGLWGWGENTTRKDFSLRRDSSSNTKLHVNVWGNDKTFNLPGGANLADGEWHFVVVTYDGNKKVRLYFDGVEAGSANFLLPLDTTDTTLYVGRSAGNATHWRGDLDDFFIVDRELTSSEIIGFIHDIESVTVASGADDAFIKDSAFNSSSSDLYVGKGSAGEVHHSYLRFADVGVPQGASIVGSTFRILGRDAKGWSSYTDIVGYDTDDAPQLTSTAEFNTAIANQTTAASGIDDVYGYGCGICDTWISREVGSIVSEIVTRGGWSSGNAMAILLLDDPGNSNGESLKIAAQENTGGGAVGDWAAQLEIVYNASGFVTYEYDAAGNRTKMTDSTGVTTYTYDNLNRVTKVTFPDADEFDYTYDAMGNRTQIAYPDTKDVDYVYDAANQLSTVTDWLANVTTYTYDDAGRLTKTAYPTGVEATYTYDDADRLLTVLNKKGAVTISTHTYTLDDVGNRTQVVDDQGTTTYAYDDLYRLTSVTYPGPTTDTYTYDPLGNRLTKDTDDYTYDNADQLTDVEGTSYTYDANGNPLTHGSDTFTWDHENRMLKANVGGNIATFTYNADGIRVQQKNEGGTIDYEVDVIAPLPLVMQDGTYSYVYGLDLISAVDGSANEVYYLYDGLGSVAALTDDSGVETDSYVYDAFGAVTSSTGTTSNDWLFTGEQRDGDTELYFLRARYYDPEIGRFLGRDPLEFAQRYAYAGNNPVAYTDPSGLEYESSAGEAYRARWMLPVPIDLLRYRAGDPRFPQLVDSVTAPLSDLRDDILDMFNLQGQAPSMMGESFYNNPSCTVLVLNTLSLGAGTVVVQGGKGAVFATTALTAGVLAGGVDVATGDWKMIPLDVATGLTWLQWTDREDWQALSRRIGVTAWAVSGASCAVLHDLSDSGSAPPSWPNLND